MICDFFALSDTTADSTKKTELEEQLKIFNSTDLIWSLCEILWVDIAPGKLQACYCIV